MARAFNIHLFIATQRPDDRTLPAEIRDRYGMRACLHVGNEATNDMILGKPAFADGGRATDLRYNTDRGTCIVNSGFGTNTKYTVVRTHHVSAHDPKPTPPTRSPPSSPAPCTSWQSTVAPSMQPWRQPPTNQRRWIT